mmetsp:Transcript_3371/g.9893  ORF Transcript_3371/g.9893 Transcript_3371/m.9893 type:complete len:80 (-) Transcript_3371:399-638(-)
MRLDRGKAGNLVLRIWNVRHKLRFPFGIVRAHFPNVVEFNYLFGTFRLDELLHHMEAFPMKSNCSFKSCDFPRRPCLKD